jgi:outer membrane lipoprotein-sorting protein
MTIRTACLIGTLVLAAGATGAAVHASDLETVEKDIREKYDQITAFETVVTTISATHIPNGGNEVKGKGKLLVVKDGERLSYSLKIKATIVANPQGEPKMIESYTEIVSSGDEVYEYIEQMGNQRVTITRYLPNDIPHVKQLLDQVHLTHDLKVVTEQTTDGQEVYVLEGTAKSPGTRPSRIVMHFAKDTGLLIKKDTFSDNPQSTSTVIYSHIETNLEVPAEKFKFIMPAGASVHDRTNE